MTQVENSKYRDSSFRLGGAVWRRRKWLATTVFIALFAAAASMIIGMPNLYRAKATILVRQEPVAPPAAGSAAMELESRLQLIHEQIISRGRLEELIGRFDLYPTLRKKRVSSDQLVERMRRDIRFERRQVELRSGDGATVAFTLGYQSWDPEVTARVVNAMASYYVQENEKLRRRIEEAPRGVDMLAEMQKELIELRTRFNENYPDIVQLRAEIATLQRLRQQEAARAAASEAGAPPVRQPAAAARAPGRETDTEIPREQFLILDSAIAPILPAAPNRIRLLVMALVLSLAISGAAVLLAEQLDTSFHRRDDLWAYTSLPILASIPRIVTRADIWLRRLRRGLVGITALAALGLLVHASWFLGQHGDQLVWMLAQRGS